MTKKSKELPRNMDAHLSHGILGLYIGFYLDKEFQNIIAWLWEVPSGSVYVLVQSP